MTRKVREIQDLVIDEISLVDKGANQHATVTIAKSADGEKENYMDVYDEQGNQLDPDTLDIGDVVFDADGDAYEIQADTDDENLDELEDQFDEEYEDELAVAKAFGPGFRSGARVAGRVRHPAKSNVAIAAGNAKIDSKAAFARGKSAAGRGVTSAAAGAASAARGARNSVYAATHKPFGPQLPGAPSTGSAAERAGVRMGRAQRSVTSWTQNNAGNIARGAGAAALVGGASYGGAEMSNRRVRKALSAEDLREELSKALTDRDRDEVISKAFGQIEELSKAAEAAQAAAEEEREIRLYAEYTEIAKSYELPTVEVDELAQALMHMAENLSYKDCEVIGKALQFAAEASDALYTEVGSIGGGDNSDVLQMVNAQVDGYIAKNAGVGREELIAEVFAQNPEAYDQYLAERG